MFDSAALAALPALLRALDQGVADATRIDRIRLLEELKSAAAAAQARETAAFTASRRAAHPATRAERGEAQRGRPDRPGATDLAVSGTPLPRLANVLVSELPRTFTALQDGWLSEWRAILVTRETIRLSRETARSAGDEIETITPTGHRHRSRPPDPPDTRTFRWRRATAPPIEIIFWPHAA